MYNYLIDGQVASLYDALNDTYDVGNSYDDYQSGKIVQLTEEQFDFYNSHKDATPEEIITSTLSVERLKRELLKKIVDYDCSIYVNSFLVNNQHMWLSRDARASLSVTIAAHKAQNISEITLWTDGDNPFPITLSVISLESLLLALELYAKQCYDVTATHKHVVSNLKTITEIRGYDYTSGYPEKLNIITNEQEGSNTTA